MPDELERDPARARLAAEKLLTAYHTAGIFGQKEMPEDLLPPGIAPGTEAHLRFITLTVALDYQRNADDLWNAARQTYQDQETTYLFDPKSVDRTPRSEIIRHLQRYKLSRKREKDAGIWQTICTTLTMEFDGQVAALLQAAGHDAVLKLIRSPKLRSGFPNLKGEKIGPLWVRMLHDNCQVDLAQLTDVPLPVDIHTAQATLQLGAVHSSGRKGPMKQLREAVQTAWQEALANQAAGAAYPLRLDEPLWLLSRNGCRHTHTWPCEFRAKCPVADLCDERRPWVSIEGDEITDRRESTIVLKG